MAREIEMKDSGGGDKPAAAQDAAAKVAAAKEKEKQQAAAPADPLADLKAVRATIERAVQQREMRLMGRAIRQTMALRKRLKAKDLTTFLQQTLPVASDARALLLPLLEKAPAEMETEAAASAAAADGSAEATAPASSSSTLKLSNLAEVEVFAYLVVLVFLIDQKVYADAKECANAAVKFLQSRNQRSLDVLAARIYFFYSLAYERTNSLAEIRSTLLALNQTATLRRDEIGQETLLNLLLRNLLHYNLYEQAEKLRSKVQRPDSHSNQQLCRYLYYLGRIRAIQLEYSEAKDCLQQASRKAPAAAIGFRVECTKWLVLVRLLLGEIPERSIFVAPRMQTALRPYFELTNAVRVGDLELFHTVATRYASVFQTDNTRNLIVRLRHNVIRTALRRISLAYSRISLADVAAKLMLTGPTAVEDAESIVAKAIRDGGIDAAVDHERGWMVSKETGDVYATLEPQAAFHSRIAFCLNTHNEAVRALRFPPNAHKQQDLEDGDKRRERQQQEQELAKHIAEEADGDF